MQLQKELDGQRKDLTETAASVRSGEETLSRLEAEKANLAERAAQQDALLKDERAKLAGLTAGLVRLARTPQGGLLAWPGAPVDAARGEILIRAALQATELKALKARSDLDALNALAHALDDKAREAEHASAELGARQAALASLVDKRQALYRQTEADRKSEEVQADKVAAEAKDLRDLMARIEAEQQEAARRKASVKPPAAPSGLFIEGAGLPVAGQVKVRFGQADDTGGSARGLTLITRPGASVTAPAAGVVRFAGPFRGYRQILILEHAGGYHSLIAGMARIDVALGTRVGAGEPVGAMDARPDGSSDLYYELRHNGQAVNPESASLLRDVKGKVR